MEYARSLIKFDVIALTETRINPNIHVHDVKCYDNEDYMLYTKSRNTRNGGGVAIYVNNNLKHELVDEFTYIKENCMESIMY